MKRTFEVVEFLNDEIFSLIDVEEYEEIPSSAFYKIKFPNFKKVYTHPLLISSITNISTRSLKYSDCVESFPDGVYEIEKITSNSSPEKRKVFKTTKAQLQWSKLLKDLKQNDLDVINKIFIYLRAAESTVECDEDLAKEYYNLAYNSLKCN